MKKLNIKIILILLILTVEMNVSYANIIENIDTLPPIRIDSVEQTPSFQKPIKYIVLKDNRTGEETIFEEGSKITYYRKDRDEKYRKTIETITANGFIVKNQNVELINIAKIKVKSINSNYEFVDIPKNGTIQIFTKKMETVGEAMKKPVKIVEPIKTVEPIKKAVKYIVVNDSETGKEVIFNEGDKIVFYRKDRDKKYYKTIETITDDGFTVQNQYVKLSNLSKIKKYNLLKDFLDKVFPWLVMLSGISLIAFASIELSAIIGTFIVGLVLTQLIGFLLSGLIVLAISGLMIRSLFRKKTAFFDLEKGAKIRIFNKK